MIRSGSRGRARRSLVAVGLGVAGLLAAGLSVASALAPAPGDEPDLVPRLPDSTNPGQHAPVFVDTVQEPGRVLYRFDSVLQNRGGALDLERDPASGHVIQTLWPTTGLPVAPDPNQPAQGGIAEDRTVSTGASMFYWSRKGHEHWHLGGAALYELLVPRAGGGTRTVVASKSKVGFCLSDTYGGQGLPSSFALGYAGSGVAGQTWCQPFQPHATFIREGVSPGYGDYYWSQLTDQWVDVTRVPPGRVVLRATANPNGYIDESNRANNTTNVSRIIPGVLTHGARARAQAGGTAAVQLTGEVVAPSIPSRRPGCPDLVPTSPVAKCYIVASRRGPLRFSVAQAPKHGRVVIVNRGGLTALGRYRPRAGYRGPDRFTFTATDVRGLRSAPSVVAVTVGG